MEPRFEPLASTSGLAIIDPIESRRFSLLTPDVVSQSPADPAEFHFPVSSACSIRTTEIELPYTVSVYVREADGTMVTDVEPPADVSLPKDEYLIELTSPVKIYLKVESELEVEANTDDIRISFGGKATVAVGARSRHKSPTGTITVPDDPEQMMRGISALSSSLKTTSPERSFPTLRGHPPRIERGDELQIPDGLSRPETGITIEIPPEYEMLYPVAPLAFYLGAELVPGSVPKLTTDTGFEHHLDSPRGFEEAVECTLKQTFLLDCVVRTEGYYPVELAEREAVETRLDFDFTELYDRSLAERVETFHGVPYQTVEDCVPTWHRTTFVRPEVENVELLPYILNDLSLIRTPPERESVETTGETDALRKEIEEFHRSPPSKTDTVFRGAVDCKAEQFTRSGSFESEPPERDYVSIPETNSLERVWAGRGIPTNGTKLLPAAYRGERPLPEDGVIDVTIVCNDSRMRREWDALSDIYGNRDELALDVTLEFGVGKDELRDLFEETTDLCHYIGHIDSQGFDCIDGVLDAETLDNAGMRVFLLNACNSYEQGKALIEAGADAGIVSLSEVGNHGAFELGETLAKLFHYGFSVGTALAFARNYTVSGTRYIALGDPGLTIAQSVNSATILYRIEDEFESSFSVSIHSYPNRIYPIGSLVMIYISGDGTQFIGSEQLDTIQIPKSEFEDFVRSHVVPVIKDGDILWSNEWTK